MHLKPAIDIIQFLDRTSRCQGDVFFYTDEGDNINLKSELSKYIFVFLADRPDILIHSRVVCKCDSDYRFLAEYLQEM